MCRRTGTVWYQCEEGAQFQHCPDCKRVVRLRRNLRLSVHGNEHMKTFRMFHISMPMKQNHGIPGHNICAEMPNDCHFPNGCINPDLSLPFGNHRLLFFFSQQVREFVG
jgi:hypothetical protein